MTYPTVDIILRDLSASDWLKSALYAALDRDPVDAANDAEFLAEILRVRCDSMLAEQVPS